MEIDRLDRVKIFKLMETLARTGPCSDNKCTHCQIMDKLTNNPKIRAMVEKAVYEVNCTGELSHLEYLFFIGFIVAWEYRDVLELEEILNRA